MGKFDAYRDDMANFGDDRDYDEDILPLGCAKCHCSLRERDAEQTDEGLFVCRDCETDRKETHERQTHT